MAVDDLIETFARTIPAMKTSEILALLAGDGDGDSLFRRTFGVHGGDLAAWSRTRKIALNLFQHEIDLRIPPRAT